MSGTVSGAEFSNCRRSVGVAERWVNEIRNFVIVAVIDGNNEVRLTDEITRHLEF